MIPKIELYDDGINIHPPASERLFQSITIGPGTPGYDHGRVEVPEFETWTGITAIVLLAVCALRRYRHETSPCVR